MSEASHRVLSAAAGFSFGHAVTLLARPPRLWFQPMTGALFFGASAPTDGPWMGFFGIVVNALVCAALFALVMPANRAPRHLAAAVLAAAALELVALFVAG